MLVKIRCDEDPSIVEWLEKKGEVYFRRHSKWDVWNYGASSASGIARKYPECSDTHNPGRWYKEQLVLCIRCVDDDLVVQEDFIGLHPMKDTTADHIVFMKRVKTYSRSTTTDNRLNHLMVLHVHREIVDNLSLTAKNSVGHKSTQTWSTWTINSELTLVKLLHNPIKFARNDWNVK